MKKIKVIELFAGIGAQREALQRAGIEHEVVAISEIDKYAVKAYELLHGEAPNLGDISKIEKLPSSLLWEVQRLLEDIYNLDINQCSIFSDEEGSENYLKTAKIIEDFINNEYLNRWIDNTKSQLPPDFINDEDSLLMEVMRIDYYSPDGKKDSNFSRQRSMLNEAHPIKEMCPRAKRFIMNAVTDFPTDEDHNYKNYYSSFQRTQTTLCIFR